MLNPVGPIVKEEGDPDFYLPYFNDVFYLEGAVYGVESSVDEVTVTIEGSDLLDYLEARAKVSLARFYNGESWIVLSATNDRGDTLLDSIHLTVIPYDNAPFPTSDPPDSILIDGHVLEYTLEAYDVEGDSIIFVPIDVPTGMTIDPDGFIYWNPDGREGRFEVTIGLTNEGCLDTNLFEFPLIVVKMTHSMFAPQFLIAHSGFTGSIPLEWEIPLAMTLDLPITLAGYTVQRSRNFEFGYETIASDRIFNSYNDSDIDYGVTYYYRVFAHYVEPEANSGYSNVAAGYSMISNDIYSTYVRDWAMIDGILDDDFWAKSNHIRNISEGIDLYVANNDIELYIAVVVDGSIARGGEFNMFFDGDNNRMWPDTLENEGVFRSYDAPGVNSFFTPYNDRDGLIIGVEEVAYEMTSRWRFDGTSIMEAKIRLDRDTRLMINPGDTIGIVFQIVNADSDTLLKFPLESNHEDPRSFGKLVLGAPGGGRPVLVANPPFVTATVETDWTYETTIEIQNVGLGIAVIDAVADDVPWLRVTPRSGLIYPLSAKTFNLQFNTDGIPPGNYVTHIVFYTNDPERTELRVEVRLTVEEHTPGNYFTIYPPYRTNGNPGTFVTVPMRSGAVYDNEITSLAFSVVCDPTHIFINNASRGTGLPADWSFNIAYMSESRVRFELSGTTPVPDSTRIVDVRFGVRGDALEGASSYIRAQDVIINDGVGLPEFVPTTGIFVVGSVLRYNWLAKLAFVGEDGAFYDSLFFGTLPHATGNYDPGIDMYNLLLPPGSPDAYFISDDFVKMRRDIRRWGDSIIVWQAVITGADGWLKWKPNRMWPGIYIEDHLEMRSDSMYHVSAGDTVWFYYYHNFTETWTIDLKRGWNMISVPLILDDMSFTTLFPSCISPAYIYSPLHSSYAAADTLKSGRGYWVLCPRDTTYEFSGEPLYSFERRLQRGWNMIGAPFNNVFFWEQRIRPADALLTGDLWAFEPPPYSRYVNSELLEAGLGYWVFAFQPADVYISSLMGKNAPQNTERDIRSSLNLRIDGSAQVVELCLIDGERKFSMMPPKAPADKNEISIEGGYAIYDADNSAHQWIVEVTMEEQGKLFVDHFGTSSFTISLGDIEIPINGDASIELSRGYHLLKVTIGDKAIMPDGFAIRAIQPNPGNSSFAISFDIAEATEYDLSVFDLHGRKLKTIESGHISSGTHTVRYTEDTLDSGVYLVRLKTDNHESVKKLMLIK